MRLMLTALLVINLNLSTYALTTINDTAGLPIITSDIVINGNEATIERSSAEGTPEFRIFHVGGTANLTLNNLIIRGGNSADGCGGAILNIDGVLTINNSAITGNRSGVDGGGICNQGSTATTTIVGSTISDNNAQNSGGGVYNNTSLSIKSSSISYNNTTGSGGAGGGLYNQSPGFPALQTLEDVEFNSNTAYEGGGIYNSGNPSFPTNGIELIDVMFDSNRATERGGAIANFDSGKITITRGIFDGNSAGFGGNIHNHGSKVLLFNSSLDDNLDPAGGDGSAILNEADAIISATDSVFSGVHNYGSVANSATATFVRSNFIRFGITNRGSLNVSESTFTDTFTDWGAINNQGQLDINSSTFTNNLYGIQNGYGAGEVSVMNSTFSGNIFYAISNGSPGDPLTISNSTFGESSRISGNFIFRNSIILTNNCDYDSRIIDGGNNIDTGVACGFSTANGSMNNIYDPLLSPLGDNDGPTKTFALLPGSPAIDAGDNLNCPSTDQRGVARPLDGDGNGSSICDIGAYEKEIPVTQLTVLDPAEVWIGLKNSDDVGIKFDLMAEAYVDSTLVSSGELASVPGGSSGFNNANLQTIPFDSFSGINSPSGSVLSIKVYARNACIGSGKNSGNARLWYNDSAANSSFGTTIGGTQSSRYLVENFGLSTSPGTGLKQKVDVAAGAKCSPFKLFGTWSITP